MGTKRDNRLIENEWKKGRDTDSSPSEPVII